MALTLKITSYQSQTLGEDASKTFTEAGGSIGRAQGNEWMLPDPERYISGRHAAILFQNGSFYLTDTSTNGVSVNGTPVGSNNSVPLSEGDRITLGDYEIEVSIEAGMPAGGTAPAWQAPPLAGDDRDLVITSPTDRTGMPGGSLDPLDFAPPPPAAASPFDAGGSMPAAEADHVSSMMESFVPPGAQAEEIPDDWDMTGFSSTPTPGPAPTPGGAPPPAPTPAQTPYAREPEPVIPEPFAPQPAAPAPAYPGAGAVPQAPAAPAPAAMPPGAGGDLLAAFLSGAGLDPAQVPQTVGSAEAMRNYGMLFREVVQGLMEVLMARASLKSEFRMPLTTIRPVENNPLKFSPSVDQALANLFMNQGGGYLSPGEAIKEGFDDIKCHQLAMVAGMQAAFRDMMVRFDPDTFQGHQDKNVMRAALMSVNKKSRFWDAYCEFYQDVTRDADSSFQRLFGEEFARAYEEQIHRLTTFKK